MQRLLKTEMSSIDDILTRSTVSLWTGGLLELLAEAEAEGSLTDQLVAESAGLSQVVWRRTAAAYALQLSKEGNFFKSSEYYLAAHLVHEAIDVLDRNKAYPAALAVAYSRLSEDDPVVPQLLEHWALHAAQGGNLSLAAKCWAAAGRLNQAAETLAKIAGRADLLAAATLTEDLQLKEVYAKQCFTECLFSRDQEVGYSVVETIPSLGWGGLLLLVYIELDKLLSTRSTNPSPGTALFSRIQQQCTEKRINCDKSLIPTIDQFIKTTTNSDKSKSRMLSAAGLISHAFLRRDEPQECLRLVAQALAEFHLYPSEMEKVSRVVFPAGTQPPEVGEVLISKPLHWQCSWPELRYFRKEICLQ